MTLTVENEVLEGKKLPLLFCPPKIPHRMRPWSNPVQIILKYLYLPKALFWDVF